LEKWHSNPFEPVVKNGVIYARGVADNKGQFMAHIAACDALNRSAGKIGCNLRILIEGGEEVGSPDLEKIFADHRDKFDADAALTADALQHSSGNPFILPGLKGGLSIELSVKGAKTECHSAMADIVPNPLWKIIHALSCIKTDDINIAIEGFYDDVRALTDEDVKLLSIAPNPIEELRKDLALGNFLPQAESNFHIARTMPTCNVSLISDGNTNQSPRFSIPTSARAVLRMNLVPDQDPLDITNKLKAHLERQGFGDVTLKIFSATPPSMTDVRHPYVKYAADIAAKAFGRTPLIYPRVVGSGPDYHFTRTLGLPSVWVPYAGADAETHAPNENMAIKAYIEGIYYSSLFFSNFSSFADKTRSAGEWI
jgi:acetylornithine deacetylase/succinyl-diaminopimelate desuccinylase-like protein